MSMGPGSFRCSICGINYPINHRFSHCMVCGTKTDRIQDPPDDDWNESVLFARQQLGYNQAQFVKGEVPIYRDSGHLWIDAADLIRAGYGDNVRTFTLFELPDGTMIEVQGRDHKRRRYWIEVLREGADG